MLFWLRNLYVRAVNLNDDCTTANMIFNTNPSSSLPNLTAHSPPRPPALADSTVYLVTPFVGGDSGMDMFDWFDENWLSQTPVSEEEFRPLLRQIIDGLRVSQTAITARLPWR